MEKIVLPDQKVMFTASNFQNNDDALRLTSFVNKNLGNTTSRGAESYLTYINTFSSPDAWLIVGRYNVKDDDIIVKFNLKQNNELKHGFEVIGKKSNLKELVEQIASKNDSVYRKSKFIKKIRNLNNGYKG